MPSPAHFKVKPWPLLLLAAVCLWLLGTPQASATSVYDPFSVKVSVRIQKGERIGDAVERIFASAREHDTVELDPSYKGCGAFKREVRDPDLILATDLNLDDVRLDFSINRLCDATGAAFLIEDPSEDPSLSELKLLFFRNSETAILDVFYEAPSSLSDHFAEKVRGAGGVPGPGGGDGYHSVLKVKRIRGGNRYQAVVKKVLANAPP
jgi:hypothetical protein